MPIVLRSLTHRIVAGLTVASLLAAGLVVASATLTPVAPAAAADFTVTGTVFRDFDADGVLDSSNTGVSGVANDAGLAGVPVTVTDRAGATWAGTTTATGTYSITATDPASTKLRVTFATPAPYESSTHGASNGTSVQFVDVSSGTGVANYGVNTLEDYSKSNPQLATIIQWAGDPQHGDEADYPSVVSTPWGTNFTSFGTQAAAAGGPYPGRTTLAKVPQTGSIWGMSYDPVGNTLYVAASYKRHSGLGPEGIGGIYKISNALTAAGAANPSATVSKFANATDLNVTFAASGIPSNATRGLGAPQSPAYDADPFAQAGKVGIGGIAVDSVGGWLYFVNLHDKKLYRVSLANPTAANVTSYTLPVTASQRPWALAIHRSKLYVGYVDTGETGSPMIADPGKSATSKGMKFYVASAPLATPGTWTTALTGDLAYTKGRIAPETSDQGDQWNSWTDSWNWTGATAGTVYVNIPTWSSRGQIYPQAIVSDLAFDAEGYLSIGITDRTSLQGGNRNYGTASESGDPTYETISNGDLLIASPNSNGTFALEADGAVGIRTTSPGSTGGQAGQGLGTGTQKEFFNDQQNLGGGTFHREIGLGAVATMPGSSSLVATTFDPLEGIRVAGTNWFSLTNGVPEAGYQHNKDVLDGPAPDPDPKGTFQKGGGLGDIDVLALQSAPIEIGNRVWFDADQDGTQDADEPAVAGVTVKLLGAGTPVPTTTTDANGNYYFSSTTTTGLTPGGGPYTVEFTTPSTGSPFAVGSPFAAVSWGDVSFTTPNAGANDELDSDAVVGSQHVASVGFTAGAAGDNDHSFDAGLTANSLFKVVKAISGSGGSAAPGATFDMAVSATDFRGNALALAAGDAAFSIGVGSGAGHTISVPAGSSATVTETSTAGISSSVVSPSGAFAVTGTSAVVQLVTVTNTLYSPGRFSVTKVVDGGAASLVATGTPFTVEYTTDPVNGTWYPLTATKGGGAVNSPLLDYGSVVTLRELTPAPIDGVAWQAPVWTGAVSHPDHTATLTIGDGTTVGVSLRNPTELTTTGFTVIKSVTGGALGSVDPAFEFDVQYAYSTAGGPVSSVLHLSKNQPSETVLNVPFGTVVTLTELDPDPDETPADVEWGTPVFTDADDEVTDNGDGTATFTVGTGPITVLLENPTTQLLGDLEITKFVTGSAAGSVDPAFVFTVNYSHAGGSGTRTITTTDAAELDNLPAGTVVTLSEAPRTGASADVLWEQPVWGGDAVDQGDGTAEVTIVANSTANVTLTNPTTQLLGGFSVTKVVDGDAAVSVLGTHPFQVTAHYLGMDHPLTVTTTGAPASVANLPQGTEVTLSEITPSGAPADVSWGTPVFSIGGVPQGATVTFTIGSTPVAVTLTNPTTRLYGKFSILKDVTGEAADTLEVDFPFSGTFSYPGLVTPKTFSVEDGETWTLPDADQIPAGTVVTVTETLPVGGLPVLSGWGTPHWTLGGSAIGTGAGGTGASATFTITSGATLALTLENPTTVTPQVDIEKGDGTGSAIVHDADTMVDGQHYNPGETRTIVFEVENTGTEKLREVTLIDGTFSGADVTAITWAFPDGTSATSTLDVDGDWTADWPNTWLTGPGSSTWAPGAVIIGTATLTVEAAEAAHVDRARVDAVGAISDIPVWDEDDYNAFSGEIQVIKYDGRIAGPAVQSGGDWVVPAKPLANPFQDANDLAHAAQSTAKVPVRIDWVVSNAGSTTLTNLLVTDTTIEGPDIDAWTCDLGDFGGPEEYSFVDDGVWDGLLPPSASFFCTGSVTLEAGQWHTDNVEVESNIVIPDVDVNGLPNGSPMLGNGGVPMLARDAGGQLVVVDDEDPFLDPAAITEIAYTGVAAWMPWAAGLAVLTVLLGAFAVVLPRRRRTQARHR